MHSLERLRRHEHVDSQCVVPLLMDADGAITDGV